MSGFVVPGAVRPPTDGGDPSPFGIWPAGVGGGGSGGEAAAHYPAVLSSAAAAVAAAGKISSPADHHLRDHRRQTNIPREVGGGEQPELDPSSVGGQHPCGGGGGGPGGAGGAGLQNTAAGMLLIQTSSPQVNQKCFS